MTLTDFASVFLNALCFGNLVYTSWGFRSVHTDGMLRAFWIERMIYASAFGIFFFTQLRDIFGVMLWLPVGSPRRMIFSGIMAIGTCFGMWALRVRRR